jgi:hypothetical protein
MADRLLLYGIVAPDEVAPGPVEFGERALESIAAAGLVGIFRRSAGADVRAPAGDAEVAAALEFSADLRALHRRFDLLPARYGVAFADSDALCRHITAHAQAYRDALARIRGSTEVALHLELPSLGERSLATPRASAPPAGETSGGRAYLLARKAAMDRRRALEGRARAVTAELLDALGEVVREHRAELKATADADVDALSLALLVERGRLRELRERFLPWLDTSDLRVVMTGPWAPSSFVGDDTTIDYGDSSR